jgi:hypothetical protein
MLAVVGSATSARATRPILGGYNARRIAKRMPLGGASVHVTAITPVRGGGYRYTFEAGPVKGYRDARRTRAEKGLRLDHTVFTEPAGVNAWGAMNAGAQAVHGQSLIEIANQKARERPPQRPTRKRPSAAQSVVLPVPPQRAR